MRGKGIYCSLRKKKISCLKTIEPSVAEPKQPRVQGREAMVVSRGKGSPEGLGGEIQIPPVPLAPAERVACWNLC